MTFPDGTIKEGWFENNVFKGGDRQADNQSPISYNQQSPENNYN